MNDWFEFLKVPVLLGLTVWATLTLYRCLVIISELSVILKEIEKELRKAREQGHE